MRPSWKLSLPFGVISSVGAWTLISIVLQNLYRSHIHLFNIDFFTWLLTAEPALRIFLQFPLFIIMYSCNWVITFFLHLILCKAKISNFLCVNNMVPLPPPWVLSQLLTNTTFKGLNPGYPLRDLPCNSFHHFAFWELDLWRDWLPQLKSGLFGLTLARERGIGKERLKWLLQLHITPPPFWAPKIKIIETIKNQNYWLKTPVYLRGGGFIQLKIIKV